MHSERSLGPLERSAKSTSLLPRAAREATPGCAACASQTLEESCCLDPRHSAVSHHPCRAHGVRTVSQPWSPSVRTANDAREDHGCSGFPGPSTRLRAALQRNLTQPGSLWSRNERSESLPDSASADRRSSSRGNPGG